MVIIKYKSCNISMWEIHKYIENKEHTILIGGAGGGVTDHENPCNS